MDVFYEISILKNFTKFTAKHLYQNLFLIKKRLWHRCFSVNFAKYLTTPFVKITSARQLLSFNLLGEKSLLTSFYSTLLSGNIYFTNNQQVVGNKAKGRISKRVFQESKARQNFRKTNISYLLIRTRTCGFRGVRNICFSEILACFPFLKHPF